MPDPEDKILGSQTREINNRFRELESKIRAIETKPKDCWDRIAALGPVATLLSGIVISAIGYYFTGELNATLRQRELQLSEAAQMKDLVQTLATADESEARAAANVLVTFGARAVGPLVKQLEQGPRSRFEAAQDALRWISVTDPGSNCEILGKVLNNRTGLFKWSTHLAVIRLLDECDCIESIPILEDYAQFIEEGGSTGLSSSVKGGLTPERFSQIENALGQSLKKLAARSK